MRARYIPATPDFPLTGMAKDDPVPFLRQQVGLRFIGGEVPRDLLTSVRRYPVFSGGDRTVRGFSAVERSIRPGRSRTSLSEEPELHRVGVGRQ